MYTKKWLEVPKISETFFDQT